MNAYMKWHFGRHAYGLVPIAGSGLGAHRGLARRACYKAARSSSAEHPSSLSIDKLDTTCSWHVAGAQVLLLSRQGRAVALERQRGRPGPGNRQRTGGGAAKIRDSAVDTRPGVMERSLMRGVQPMPPHTNQRFGPGVTERIARSVGSPVRQPLNQRFGR